MIGVKRTSNFELPLAKEVRYERGQKRTNSFEEPQQKLVKDRQGDKVFGGPSSILHGGFQNYFLIPSDNQFCSKPLREVFQNRSVTADALEGCVIYMENLNNPLQERLMCRTTMERIIVLAEAQFGSCVQVQLMHHVKYLIETHSK